MPPSPQRDTPGAGRAFVYDGLGVRVEAEDERPLAWLAEFFGPAFDPDGALTRCRVPLVEDAARYRALEAAGPAPGDPLVDAFTLDQGMVMLPARNGRAGATTLFDPPFAVFYEATADRRTFTLLSRPDEVAWRTGLLRVVRELASNHVEGVGGLILHAAGLAVNGRALALAGPSAAGKTTLLIHALRIGHGCYLANDRIRVAFAGDNVTFRGMPTVVTLRQDTRARFPDLAARLAASTYHHRFTLAEGGGPPKPWSDGRLGLTPAQFCDLLGAPRAAECPAAALVFPQITGVRGGIMLVRLTPDDVRARLAGTLLAAGAGRRPTTLFIPQGTPSLPDADVLAARCRRLAALLPGYECRLGLDAYADPGSMAPLLELCA